jgi:hypothetical protein
MSGYFTVLLCASVISSFAVALVPETRGDSLSKQVRFVSSLMIAILTLAPFAAVIKGADSMIDNFVIPQASGGTSGEDWVITESAELIEEGITKLVADKFSLDINEVKTTLTLDDSDPQAVVIKKITITLTGKALWAPSDDIEKYVSDTFGCPADAVGGR